MSATHDEMCASRKGRACNCGVETAESIVTMLQAELAGAKRELVDAANMLSTLQILHDKAMAERDEARAKAAAALSIAEDARRERDEAFRQLASEKNAVLEAEAAVKRAFSMLEPILYQPICFTHGT